jgi:uncharacterized protein (DUF305 family)
LLRPQLLGLTAAALFAFTAVVGAQSKSPADDEFMTAMERMDKTMMQASDPDAAVSFAKKMIAHHQGAIDMSQTVLKHTKDATIRKMAEKTIKDQGKEIKDLQTWIAKKGGAT